MLSLEKLCSTESNSSSVTLRWVAFSCKTMSRLELELYDKASKYFVVFVHLLCMQCKVMLSKHFIPIKQTNLTHIQSTVAEYRTTLYVGDVKNNCIAMCTVNIHKNHMGLINANLSIITAMYTTNTSHQRTMIGVLAVIDNKLSLVSSSLKKLMH